jgi:CDP-diacylglycerol--glycerol-3-phosphate 3-phosphatidyltransferase
VRSEADRREKGAMTTANKVTIIRILLVPFFVVHVLYYASDGAEWHRWAALLSFAVASLSDGIDGYIARRFNQRSELGAILDPLADKLLLVSGMVLLSLDTGGRFERVPLFLTGTVLSRDALLVIGLIVIHLTCGKTVVRPRMTGKIATVCQMLVIAWILLKWHGAWLPAWVWTATLFTAASGLLYVMDGVRELSASPSSGPKPAQ